ncbi:MAG: N-carbamoyl-L-amino acid amidohydrolase [Colwellia sp.]|nr:N-carbamoyl-L-amino acid amidohydrolase [Colwellia sp.]
MSKLPYLKDQRLADVIAAIQVMSTYKFYKLDFIGWSKKITGSEGDAEEWKQIFIEHPEFFRLNNDKQKVSLVWRRSYQRNFHVDDEKILTREEIDKLPTKERSERISRAPLSNNDTATLISTAVNLHTRAIESEKEKRWLLPSLVTILAVCLGAMIKSWT